MKYLTFLFFLVYTATCSAQIDPISWEYSSVKLDDGSYELVLKASMDGDWVVYSQFTPDGGPIATEISFDELEGLNTSGAVEERGKLIKKNSPLFDLEVYKFENPVEFVQSAEIKKGVTSVTGTITYMTCNGMQCLPPKEKEFTIQIKE